MEPNAFLSVYWRTDIWPEVFVAMGFREEWRSRFFDVYEPAVGAIDYERFGFVRRLKASRVDLSNKGECAQFQIMEGAIESRHGRGDRGRGRRTRDVSRGALIREGAHA